MKKYMRLFLVFLIYICLPVNGSAEEQVKVDIHGYLSQGFMYSNRNNFLADTEKGTFQFNELGINFAADLTDRLRLGIQLAARDLGDIGNDQVMIDWAYADYRWQDWLGIRAGRIKVPVGLYNTTRDIDLLRTFILLPQGIYNESFRDLLTSMKGISAYGEVPINALGNISYQVLFGTININKDGTTTKIAESRSGAKVQKYEPGKLLSWAIIWEPPLQGLRIGVSQESTGMKSFSTLTKDMTIPVPFPPYTITIAEQGTTVITDTPDYLKTVYSFEYTWKDLILAAEYDLENHKNIIQVTGLEPMELDYKFESFYGSACYRFNKWFEAGAYYSVYYRDRDDRDGTKTPYDPTFSAFQKDACLTFRFDMNDHWVFKLEGHLMDGTGLCLTVDNLNENGALQLDRRWFLLAAKMTFSF
jgi:hypothetical protein